jgi:hypothetical protein
MTNFDRASDTNIDLQKVASWHEESDTDDNKLDLSDVAQVIGAKRQPQALTLGLGQHWKQRSLLWTA